MSLLYGSKTSNATRAGDARAEGGAGSGRSSTLEAPRSSGGKRYTAGTVHHVPAKMLMLHYAICVTKRTDTRRQSRRPSRRLPSPLCARRRLTHTGATVNSVLKCDYRLGVWGDTDVMSGLITTARADDAFLKPIALVEKALAAPSSTLICARASSHQSMKIFMMFVSSLACADDEASR